MDTTGEIMPHTAPLTVSATSSSYTSQDHSYFSPQVPFTIPSPISPYGVRSLMIAHSAAATTTTTTTATTTAPGGTIIVSTITLRATSHVSAHPLPTTSTHQSDNALQQFAPHIPLAPPSTLSLSLAPQRNPSSSLTSPSSSSVQSRDGVIQSSSSPQMLLSSTPEQHTLSVQLPLNVQPELVTISANKGDRLRVVAEAWGGGNECHYEWQISFPPRDIEMSAVHARFDPNGRLTLKARRREAMKVCQYSF